MALSVLQAIRKKMKASEMQMQGWLLSARKFDRRRFIMSNVLVLFYTILCPEVSEMKNNDRHVNISH